jgi:hypothetical protein
MRRRVRGIHFRAARDSNERGSRAACRVGLAQMLEFEYAAILRDRLIKLRGEK